MLTRHTHRAQRRSRHFANTLEPVLDATPIRGRLGLTVDDVEELLLAVEDRLEACPADRRPRLQRGRNALERELAVLLED